MTRAARLGRALAAALLAAATVRPAPAAAPKEPILSESTSVRLAQFEVSVGGPKEIVAALRPADFTLKVNGRQVESFALDWDCPGGAPADLASRTEPVVAPRSRPASFLFYFDMPNLTMSGRQQAMDMAKSYVQRLVRDGNRGMILSNAATVTTVAPFTSEPEALQAALERLEVDKTQWDPYPSAEQTRLADVITRLNKDGPDAAMGTARAYYFDDRWRGERSLKRLGMALGFLADVDAPRVVIYFADTMREEPGEVYLKLFSQRVLDSVRTPAKDVGVSPLQRVVREAAAHGVRFYTVQAEGLTAGNARTAVSPYGAVSGAALTRSLPNGGVEDAQQALTSLAIETGGQAFLNGVSSTRVAESIRTDLACVLMVSFDPTGFPEDLPFPVKLVPRSQDIDLHYRGTMVVQSEAARKTARLLAAFLSPEAKASQVPVHAAVIPLGYSDHEFLGLVQVAVASGAEPGATWDLAASVVSRERVTEEGAGRLIVSAARVPVVYEKPMRFAPGPFEIVSVAHDTESGAIASRHAEGQWPDPDAADAVVGPIAVLQPVAGAFLREDRPSKAGNLVVSAEEAASADRLTALVGLVCRRKGLKTPLVVERRLIGETSAPFAPMEIEPGEDRCFQVRDLLPAGTMSAGTFRYEIRVLRGDTELARGDRVFHCVAPATGAHPAPPPAQP